MRPILVFGAGGRVGGELARLALREPAPYMIGLDRSDCDFLTPSTIRPVVERVNPKAIINLAACTLPTAERNRGEALAANTVAVEYLTSWLAVPLIHISTDCVFSGEKTGPYVEGDECRAANWYGETKHRAEGIIADDLDAHIIIRTTGVYLADKPNFLKLVIDKAKAGESLTVVTDSIYTPTDARELAKAILAATERVIEDPSVSGTYHFAGPDVMSYMDFAELVLEEAGLAMPLIGTTMAEREKIEGFKRPRNAALNSDKFAETFGLRHRPTRECVRELVNPA